MTEPSQRDEEIARGEGLDMLDQAQVLKTDEIGGVKIPSPKFIPRYSLRMVKDSTLPAEEILMTKPGDAARVVAAYTEGAVQEHLLVILLNTDNVMMGILPVSAGTINQTLVDPGDVLTPVLTSRMPAFILAHNHPSGNPAPSKDDLATFRHIKAAAELMHRKLIDCIIVGEGNRYYSWAESQPYEVRMVGGRP